MRNNTLVKEKVQLHVAVFGFRLQPRAINPPATRCFMKPANREKVQQKHSEGADRVEKQV